MNPFHTQTESDPEFQRALSPAEVSFMSALCLLLLGLAVGLLAFFLFGCTKPPVPPGPAFDKVNGQPTESADAGPGRVESKPLDLAKSPRFPVVYFEFDSDEIREADRAGLAAAAQGLRASWCCDVDGYASSEGTEAYNLALGARRASRVGDFIQAYRGITVLETSYGEERPAPGGPEKSRRVEIRCE